MFVFVLFLAFVQISLARRNNESEAIYNANECISGVYVKQWLTIHLSPGRKPAIFPSCNFSVLVASINKYGHARFRDVKLHSFEGIIVLLLNTSSPLP